MVRVTSDSGHLVIITNAIPEKRMPDFEEFGKELNLKIKHEKINLSV